MLNEIIHFTLCLFLFISAVLSFSMAIYFFWKSFFLELYLNSFCLFDKVLIDKFLF